MQVSTQRRPDDIAAAPAIALDEQPRRYWLHALIIASATTWAVIFGIAKLLLAFI